jgi:hypothetical protein
LAWADTKYKKFGIIKIEGDKVRVYKDHTNYITIPAGK